MPMNTKQCIIFFQMELIWGIFLFTITFLHTTPSEAGRVLPVNSKSFMKRVGPFFNERRVYNHPYIEDHHVRVRSFLLHLWGITTL